MNEGIGPDIWLAGDPADLDKYMNNGIKGIVTNTVVQRELVQKYGTLTELTKKYLEITDKKIAIEIDGKASSSLISMVPTAVPKVAFEGLVNVTENVSSYSSVLSVRIPTAMD